jgi:exosortase/archaeosortase family protein
MNEEGEVFGLILRYMFLVIIAIPNLYLFYLIFTPLTLHLSKILFSIFFEVKALNNVLLIGEYAIVLIPACIAGSAYYLLTILNLSTKGIKLEKRIQILLTSYVLLLIFNSLRIFFLGILYINESITFDFFHKFLWYFVSILFVVFIWFFLVKLYSIKDIPFVSDIKYLFKNSLFKENDL